MKNGCLTSYIFHTECSDVSTTLQWAGTVIKEAAWFGIYVLVRCTCAAPEPSEASLLLLSDRLTVSARRGRLSYADGLHHLCISGLRYATSQV